MTEMVKSNSTDLALPSTGDEGAWSPQERALVEAAGLVSKGRFAPRPTVEAYLAHCRRTGLDPIARQIYAIERGGRWNIQVSIDGARLIAERSGKYRGQTPTEWTKDGVNWVQVWLERDPPAAARVGVIRADFAEPLFTVATWSQYNAGGSMWQKMGPLMLGKCAEMLALRKAFPQDLSGLYSSEEMAQADPQTEASSSARAQHTGSHAVRSADEPAAPPVADEAWVKKADACSAIEALKDLYRKARHEGVLGLRLASGSTVDEMLQARAKDLQTAPKEDVVDAEVVDEGPFLKAISLAETADDLAKIQEQAERVGAWTDEVQKAATQRAASLSWADGDAA